MATDDITLLADALSKAHVGDEELSYKGRGLKLDSQESVEELVRDIEEFRGLRALRLEGNTVGVEAAEAIAKALENKDELQRCHWSDMFTGRLRSEIPLALRSLGSALMSAGARLTELDLSDNAFGPDGVKSVEQLLKSATCHSLRELRLNNCGMGTGGGKVLAEALMESHRRSAALGSPLRLRVFVAGRNRLENEGARALARAFKLLGSLEEVHLPQNGITHGGVVSLASACRQNPKLRVLNLNDNTFTKRGSVAMAQALRNLRNVEVINFGDCLVRSEGAIALAAVLREALPVLKELNLSFGEINQPAALSVAQAARDKPQLKRLDLNGNCLGEEGCEALRDLMELRAGGELLASLSDDEGDEDDDEDDGESEEEEEEEECSGGEDDEDDEGVEEDGAAEFRSFLCCPSAESLLRLSHSRTELQTQVNATEPLRAAHVFLKISSVYSEEPETRRAVLETVDAVMKKLLSGSTLQSYCFISTLLVAMGLLKGEGKVKKTSPLQTPLLCLHHAARQDYITQDVAALLQLFLPKNTADPQRG